MWRGLPPAFWYLWGGTLLNRFGGFVVPFLALYLTGDRGLSVAEAGLVTAVYGAGGFLGGPCGGMLADRLGRRTTLIIALGAGAATMLLFGQARAFAPLVAVTALLGFCNDMYRPAVQAALVDVVPPKDCQRAYGLLYWAINLGFASAAVVGGTFAQGHFHTLITVDAATTFGFALVVFLRVPESRPESGRTRLSYLQPYSDRLMVAFILLSLCVAVVFQQSMVTLPIDLRAHGISAATYGRLIAINGVLIVVLQPLLVTFAQRWTRARALFAGATLTGLGFGINGVADGVGIYALAIVIWTLGEILMSPVTPTIVADLAPPSLRGSYQGALQLTSGAATFLAPLAGAFVLERGGGHVLWSACLVLGLAAAVGLAAVARLTELRRHRDAAALAS